MVKGFQPIMPTFQGQVSEDDLMKLLAYIKTLAKPSVGAAAPGRPATTAPEAGAATQGAATLQTGPTP